MCNYKILVKVTGSIAAYKSAYLVSKLVQNGYEVKVVATENGLKFIGAATFEALTGNPVFTDSFLSDQMMSHINLTKWADLTIVCPATANTINKLANGIADNLLTSLFLAHDWTKPYLIAPAMNPSMFDHPATKNSFNKLTEWGVKILSTDKGHLACGDIGYGKLLDPEKIFQIIFNSIKGNKKKKKKILITSGGTKEEIDGIRFLTNISTGKTASTIANYFLLRGYDVTFLHSSESVIPDFECDKISFSTFSDLDSKLKNILSQQKFDIVIQMAAISDYSPVNLFVDDNAITLPCKTKINSDSDFIDIKLRRNYKIINRLNEYSVNKNIKIVGFKLTSGAKEEEQLLAVEKILNDNSIHYVVANDTKDRTKNGQQMNFSVHKRNMKIVECITVENLSEKLEQIIEENI